MKKRKKITREKKKRHALANFGKFWDFLGFFFTMVSSGKVSFSAKCLFGRIDGLIFFEKKKLDFGFEIFHIFYAKKWPFFRFLDPPYFWAEGPIFFLAILLKFLPKTKLTGLVSPPDPNLLISPNLKCDCSLRVTP